MAEMADYCTKRDFNFDRFGELKINNTDYFIGQEGTDLILFDKTFDEMEEIDDYEYL